MRLPTLLLSALLSLSTLIVATPFPGGDDDWDGHDGHRHRHGCLTDHSAQKISSVWANFFTDPTTLNTLGEKFITEDFQEFSDGINWVTPNSDHTVSLLFLTFFQALLLSHRPPAATKGRKLQARRRGTRTSSALEFEIFWRQLTSMMTYYRLSSINVSGSPFSTPQPLHTLTLL
jgi:hypothetical protein